MSNLLNKIIIMKKIANLQQLELDAVQNCEPNLLLKAFRKYYYPTSEDFEELAEEGKPLNEYQQIALCLM